MRYSICNEKGMVKNMEQIPVFQKSMRGYATDEVDAYIRALAEKQEALLAENSDLKNQLIDTLALLQPAKENASRIQNAAAEATAEAGRILADAKEQAAALLRSAKEACDAEIAAYRSSVAEELALFTEIRSLALRFKETLDAQYAAQTEAISAAAAKLALAEPKSEAEFSARILSRMREKLIRDKEEKEKAAKSLDPEIKEALDNERNAVASKDRTRSRTVSWLDGSKA